MKKIVLFSTIVMSAFQSQSQVTLHEEFFNGSIGTWHSVSVSDTNDQWSNSNGVMLINGIGEENDNDWLISPAIDLNNTQREYFLFDYNDVNNGALIELYYSVNYNGSGQASDVNAATWNALPLRLLDIERLTCMSTLFQRHPAIDISFIQGTQVYFAFKYNGTSTVAKQYKIDNVHIEADYYNSILSSVPQNLLCADLKTALYHIIKIQPNVIHYTSTSYDVWDAMLHTDTRLNDAGTDTIMWDMFTDIPNDTGEFELDPCTGRDNGSCSGGEGNCYQREHTFPKSWWGGGGSYPSDTFYVDMHHLTPADRTLNIQKSNYPPGEVDVPSSQGSNGFKVGTNAAYPCDSTMKYFEPIDAYKGDYARMYLFMITRYEPHISSWDSIITESNCALDGQTYPGVEPWLLQTLLTWHLNDTVSQKEIDRNNAVYAIQGNRNPYIDHPEWVEYIWGNTISSCESISLGVSGTTKDEISVFPNPLSNQLMIESTSPLTATVVLFSIHGVIVKQMIAENTYNVMMDVSTLPSGMYLLKVNDTVKKLVKP